MQLKKHNLIAPSTYQESLCLAFSNEVYQSNKEKYAERNKSDKDKIKSDIYKGKLAEYAVYNFLVANGKQVTSPDIMIYNKHDKSFGADLYVNKTSPLHIKSCMHVDTLNNSWLFQPNDPVTILPSEDDMIAFVIIKPDATFYCYLARATEMIDIYSAPRNPLLRKKAIYESSLIKLL
jgi:hypothetical protein